MGRKEHLRQVMGNLLFQIHNHPIYQKVLEETMPFFTDKFKSKNRASVSEEFALSLNLGLHSLYNGGVTTATTAGGYYRCLKKHENWRCDISKDDYIDGSVDSRLQIAKVLH